MHELVSDLLQLAHDVGVPHAEPAPRGDGKSASTLVIVAVFAVSAAVLGPLLFLRKRIDSR